MVVIVVIPEERVTIINSSFCEIKRQPLTCYINLNVLLHSARNSTQVLPEIIEARGCHWMPWSDNVTSDNKI